MVSDEQVACRVRARVRTMTQPGSLRRRLLFCLYVLVDCSCKQAVATQLGVLHVTRSVRHSLAERRSSYLTAGVQALKSQISLCMT